MKTVIVISGWAHGLDAIRPIGNALRDQFEVELMTGTQVLKNRKIPDTDVIVTGSMGGLLAMELLPETCKKLVLISSTAKFCAAEDYPCGTHEKILKRMIVQLKRKPEAVLSEFFRNVHHPYEFHTFEGVNEPLEDLVAGLEYLQKSDVREKVPTLGIPVQLFHGSQDRIIPPGAAQWLADHLPNSDLTVYEDGHGLAAHHFQDMMTGIREFLLP
ncbi:alpha/beta fold hydrolase [Pontiella agarivorans]|uniref:Alpha/beta hydrolase n=1 Tax=Pontiella agarivorans TaxID=3038953 RepID=A0ABU5MV53_9BACT|nr:alpha/beta hydrolase [Pontiella agarivorans]MDZ8118068.1 alpha/beta hydrolase [Pontiella agarivorans]